MNQVLVRAIEKHGKLNQTIQAIQELGELIVALTKGDLDSILEEIADVEVMIEQLKYMYGSTSTIKTSKIKRLNERMERDSIE